MGACLRLVTTAADAEPARARSHDLIGLKTGDAAINPDAQVVVMTTEILRNMLYSSAGGKAGDASLANVGLVVLDEVHYMSDAERGTVWEECVIYCPKEVQLVCLSATVGNPDDLQAWIAQVHGPCELVTSSWRPIPLSFFFVKRGGDDRDGVQGLVPLLNRRGDRLNRLLEGRVEEGQDSRPGGSRMVSSWRKDAPSQDFVLRHLVQQELLPAIWFIFSRARCDEAVMAAAAAATSPSAALLVRPDEKARLSAALEALRKSCPEAVREEYAGPLLAGVAAHHAGCLPAWKTMVEELFQEGLIKVVFATETLAAGINMPARAVVLSTTSKRDDLGPRSLTVNEFMQMAGRAGRRGYDTQGTVVLVQSPFEGPSSGAELALGEPEVRPSAADACHRYFLTPVLSAEGAGITFCRVVWHGAQPAAWPLARAGAVRRDRLLRQLPAVACAHGAHRPLRHHDG